MDVIGIVDRLAEREPVDLPFISLYVSWGDCCATASIPGGLLDE